VQGSALGVSVLCPGLVSTRLIEGNVEQGPSGINLGAHEVELEESMRRAVDPHLVAQAVVRGIYDQRFWLFTHSELKPALDDWLEELRMALRVIWGLCRAGSPAAGRGFFPQLY
jgi:hypothetical protein